MKRKILKVRKYKAGYEIRTELVDGTNFGCEDYTVKTAYTLSGDYIGNTKLAYRLCKKRGIIPEKINNDSNICSIGFCDKEQKWYGWSHRAMFGFGIGSKVKKGDCAFEPGNILELYTFLSNEERENIVKADAKGITIKCKKYRSVAPVDPSVEDSRVERVNEYESYRTEEVGRGEWTARVLDDAKQMAIDFAESVS